MDEHVYVSCRIEEFSSIVPNQPQLSTNSTGEVNYQLSTNSTGEVNYQLSTNSTGEVNYQLSTNSTAR